MRKTVPWPAKGSKEATETSIVWLFFGTLGPLGVQMEARTAKITKISPKLHPKLSPRHSKLGQNKTSPLSDTQKASKKCDSGPCFLHFQSNDSAGRVLVAQENTRTQALKKCDNGPLPLRV